MDHSGSTIASSDLSEQKSAFPIPSGFVYHLQLSKQESVGTPPLASSRRYSRGCGGQTIATLTAGPASQLGQVQLPTTREPCAASVLSGLSRGLVPRLVAAAPL